jgi:hypothetical protein
VLSDEKGEVMNYPACPHCQLRFTAVQGAVLRGCPECDQPLRVFTRPTAVIGFALYEPDPAAEHLPDATAAALVVPPHRP